MCHLLLNATVIGPSNEEGYLGATFMGSSPPTEARAGRRAPSQQEGTGGLRLLLASSTEGGSTGLWPAAGPAADFWVKRELWDARGKVGSTQAPPHSKQKTLERRSGLRLPTCHPGTCRPGGSPASARLRPAQLGDHSVLGDSRGSVRGNVSLVTPTPAVSWEKAPEVQRACRSQCLWRLGAALVVTKGGAPSLGCHSLTPPSLGSPIQRGARSP